MLGNACLNIFKDTAKYEVVGTVRSNSCLKYFSKEQQKKILTDIDIANINTQKALFDAEKPDIVINCIGIVKQSADGNNPLQALMLNSLLPHQLDQLCELHQARLIHISTDCVFSGNKGGPYLESDESDANDLYGRSKYLGEISNSPWTLTLRTSYIGNELEGANGLLEWFLGQQINCQGFTRAIYSGVPTVILAQIIEMIIEKYPTLSGIYQVASSPISKYNLLQLIANVFGKSIEIIPNNELVIDRSLDGSKFHHATGYLAPSWEEMVEKMYVDRMTNVQK